MSGSDRLQHYARRGACLLLASLIVAGSLSVWAYGAEHPARHGYTVTITQLQ
ncbi:MAG TPA: hypothetical protein VKB34_14825 [Povalibacter sp.]|nr:hypothetical protein [Povalibacter sp.]